jgi:hypothetical protein
VFAVLPLWRAVGWLTPLGPLPELTAWLNRQWLEQCGFSGSQQALFLYLPGGGVKVAKLRLVSDVICNRRKYS